MPTKVFGDLIEIGNQRAHFIHNDNAAIFANLGPDDLPFNDPAIKASVREPPILAWNHFKLIYLGTDLLQWWHGVFAFVFVFVFVFACFHQSTRQEAGLGSSSSPALLMQVNGQVRSLDHSLIIRDKAI